MATPLAQLINCEPRESGIETFCQMACGRSAKKFMQVQVKGAHISVGEATAEVMNSPDQATYALDLRVCSPCFNEFVMQLLGAGRELQSSLA